MNLCFVKVTFGICLKYSLFFVLVFISQIITAAPDGKKSNSFDIIGILWEVSKEGIAPSYIFGTIHSEDKRVLQFPEAVIQSFNDSKTFVLEILLDTDNKREILKKMFFRNGRTLQATIGDEYYLKTVKKMKEKGFLIDLVKFMKPWAVFTILNMPAQETGLFMDAILYKKAQTQQKIIRALETAAEQTAVFNDMKMTSQIALLKSTLDEKTDFDVMLEELIQVYLERNLDKLLLISQKYEEGIEKEIAEEFNFRLIVNRNHRMVKRMLPFLSEGYCFVAVGALHLPGMEGILNLLKREGYSVRPIY